MVKIWKMHWKLTIAQRHYYCVNISITKTWILNLCLYDSNELPNFLFVKIHASYELKCKRPYQILSLSRKDKILIIWFLIKGRHLKCLLVIEELLWFFSLCELPSLNYKSNFRDFVFLAEWQNLIGPFIQIRTFVT